MSATTARKTTGFLAVVDCIGVARGSGKETRCGKHSRFVGLSPAIPTVRERADQQCASVSPIVRRVSRNVRPAPPSVSNSARRKAPFIARPGDHYCSPLQLGGNYTSTDMGKITSLAMLDALRKLMTQAQSRLAPEVAPTTAPAPSPPTTAVTAPTAATAGVSKQ